MRAAVRYLRRCSLSYKVMSVGPETPWRADRHSSRAGGEPPVNTGRRPTADATSWRPVGRSTEELPMTASSIDVHRWVRTTRCVRLHIDLHRVDSSLCR